MKLCFINFDLPVSLSLLFILFFVCVLLNKIFIIFIFILIYYNVILFCVHGCSFGFQQAPLAFNCLCTPLNDYRRWRCLIVVHSAILWVQSLSKPAMSRADPKLRIQSFGRVCLARQYFCLHHLIPRYSRNSSHIEHFNVIAFIAWPRAFVDLWSWQIKHNHSSTGFLGSFFFFAFTLNLIIFRCFF